MQSNPIFLNGGKMAIKWIDCPQYDNCLDKAVEEEKRTKGQVTGWSCQNCSLFIHSKPPSKEIVLFKTMKKGHID